ncbi:histidine phosphatase family protein [Bacillus solimangrovi]|uniref:Alpha-ribazole phosphatase n=1 Tax=Bacillus solimangrovi TaxID=1305675 RepID=A0A1E5LHI5_9BACI|nr:histidine phosphatase family protein [Bacillus solimangrovi]OEH93516.1 hypothetical protein BFG57_00545 [Bacillus solimangrovi]
MDDRLVLTLLRHGVTEANLAKQYLGWRDIPLQARTKERLKENTSLKVDLLVSSDLIRCVETANKLFPRHHIYKMASLREYHFGDWDGFTYEQLKHEPSYQRWLSDMSIRVPNGESLYDFQTRIRQGLLKITDMISKEGVRNVVVVTHGGVIRQLLSWLSPDEKDFWEWDVPYQGGYRLVTTLQRLRRSERCTLLQVVSAKENEDGFTSITT